MDINAILIAILDDEIELSEYDDDKIKSGIWEHDDNTKFNDIEIVPFKAVVAYVAKSVILGEDHIVKSFSIKYREKLARAVDKRLKALFEYQATNSINKTYEASMDMQEEHNLINPDGYQYRTSKVIMGSYYKHFVGIDAVKARRNIKHFQEARTIIEFLRKKLITLIDGQVNFIDYNELRKELQKDHHKPSKWNQMKAELVEELYTALLQASPSHDNGRKDTAMKDTARLHKIATYTVSNLLSLESIDMPILLNSTHP